VWNGSDQAMIRVYIARLLFEIRYVRIVYLPVDPMTTAGYALYFRPIIAGRFHIYPNIFEIKYVRRGDVIPVKPSIPVSTLSEKYLNTARKWYLK
jgi:hypothetical protein